MEAKLSKIYYTILNEEREFSEEENTNLANMFGVSSTLDDAATEVLNATKSIKDEESIRKIFDVFGELLTLSSNWDSKVADYLSRISDNVLRKEAETLYQGVCKLHRSKYEKEEG